MLLFGHIGITAGAVRVYDILISRAKPENIYSPASNSKVDSTTDRSQPRLQKSLSDTKKLVGSVDYRMVVLGSLLPDVIDKPVMFLMANLAGGASLSGRGYAHTLLFNLALFIGGLVFLRYRKLWLFTISLCSFGHLILDQIWNRPVVLLWPLFGPLPEGETAGWLSNILEGLFSHPGTYIPEIIGLAIVLLFVYRLAVKRGIISFIKEGVLS